jgi:hypothetical protein
LLVGALAVKTSRSSEGLGVPPAMAMGEGAPGASEAGEPDPMVPGEELEHAAPEDAVPPPEMRMENVSCDFSPWVGHPVDEDAVKATQRPYRILPPGAMATMDYSPQRINLDTDENGIVTRVHCG